MTRICHITTSHPANDTRILRHECVSLARAGFDVHLIAPYDGPHDQLPDRQRGQPNDQPQDQPLDQDELVDGVHIVRMKKSTTFLERMVQTPLRAIALAEEIDPDLYHFHDPESIPWMRRLARRTDRPVVWDAHENYRYTIPQFNSLRVQALSDAAGRWFDLMEIRACLRDFAGVVTVNEKMAGRYKKHGIRTVAACNYADISEIPWPPRVSRSLRPRFVSTGGQFADRGALEILDAFNLLDPQLDCELAFWGTFYPPEFADEIRARAYRTPATADRVQVGGPYPWKVLAGELIPTAWAGCVLFNPTEKNDLESIPNRFFECWANGVPVIATSGSETARLIKEEGGGFVVDRNDTRAIAEAFRELAENPDLAVKMGSAGRRAVEREYCWEKAFQNILLLYAALGVNPQVLAKTRPGRTALAP